jgi:uncharacterized protein DUF4431
MWQLALRRSAFLIVLLPALAVAQLEIVGCKAYEPALVSLHGTLVRETLAGPPNYRDIHKGDDPETIWLLKLEPPICVDEDKAQPDLNPSQRNVRKVQLVLDKEHGERANGLRGKRVVATGTLFGAHTGHHHTPVLLTVTYLDLPRWK